MKKKKIMLIIVAAFTALSLFAGCGMSRAKSAKATIAAHNGEAEYYEDADTFAGANQSNGKAVMGARSAKSADAGMQETEAAAPAEDPSGSNQSQGSSTSSNQTQTNLDPTKGRLLIRNVTMAAETKDFDNARKSVEDKIKEVGGYIENSSISGTGKSGNLRRASLKIRVPAETLDDLINAVGNNCTVTSTSERTSDVTLNYVDTKAKLESLRVEQKQLTELLSQAKDLDSIIVLQERLTQIRYQIESAESTLRVLENQVSYATLTLSIREVMEIKPQEEPHVETYGEKVARTFKESLHNIGEFFKGLFLVIVAVSPVFVPMIIITVVALVIVLSAVKKKRKKRAAALAAQQAQYQAQFKAQAPAAAQSNTEEKKPEEKADEKKDEEKK